MDIKPDKVYRTEFPGLTFRPGTISGIIQPHRDTSPMGPEWMSSLLFDVAFKYGPQVDHYQPVFFSRYCRSPYAKWRVQERLRDRAKEEGREVTRAEKHAGLGGSIYDTSRYMVGEMVAHWEEAIEEDDRPSIVFVDDFLQLKKYAGSTPAKELRRWADESQIPIVAAIPVWKLEEDAQSDFDIGWYTDAEPIAPVLDELIVPVPKKHWRDPPEFVALETQQGAVPIIPRS